MVPTLFFYQLVLVALVWLYVMLQWAWPSDSATCPTTREPTPFAGRTTKPHATGIIEMPGGNLTRCFCLD